MFLADRAKKFANDSLEAVRTTYDDYKKKQFGPKSSPDADEDNRSSTLLGRRNRCEGGHYRSQG